MSVRAEPLQLRAAQQCVDHLSSSGRWIGGEWNPPLARRPGCAPLLFNGARARALLAGHHVMVMGDLAARHWYAALVYLLNETASPEEVAEGYPQHIGPCWNPDSMRRGGYEFAGWGHIKKSSPCFLRWYGSKAGTLHNLTLNHAPGSKACASAHSQDRSMLIPQPRTLPQLPCQSGAISCCSLSVRHISHLRGRVGARHQPRCDDLAAS